MAIAKMEKLTLTFKAGHLDQMLRLLQGFQGVHIDTGYESTIPPAMKEAINKGIRETENNLREIQSAYSVLKGRERSSMFSVLNSEEKRLSISELTRLVEASDWKKILEEVIQTDRRLQNARIRRQEIAKLLATLKKWGHLRYNPLDFKKLHRATAVFGSVHAKHAAEFSEILAKYEEDGIVVENVAAEEDRAYFLLICHNSQKEKISEFMNEFSFSEEGYPFSRPQAEAASELEAEESLLLAEEKEIGALIVEQSKYNEILLFAEDYNLNILLRKKKSLEITYDGDSITINGWIVSEGRESFQKILAENVPAGDYKASISQVKDSDIDSVPIKLKNNKLAAVYESLTEMYSLPKYNELDPTPVMTVFYLIFFGMMVADVGYGLAICLIGALARKVFHLKRGTQNFVDFLFYLSFPIMGWGLIYGSFCGMDLPFGLISVTVDIIPMTVLSIILGYFHIMTGLVLHMLNQIKLRNYFDMMTGGLAWFLTFLGGGAMVLAAALPVGGLLFGLGGAILGIGLAMSIVVPAVQYGKRWYAGVGKGLYSLYGATSYLGDFVSFTRLMALSVAGGSVALAFNTILSFLPVPLKFTLGILLAVFLHALNMFLSMLSAYVHGIRLQFIEFFGKFYTGGGKKFEPFKAAEKNVIISEEGLS